jgi:type II secretory pathway pseudopilin PulG
MNNFDREKTERRNTKGFTLLEVTIAIFMLSMAAFAGFSLIQGTIISASINKQRLTAYYLAQEALEVVRNTRDGNWLEQQEDEGVLWTDGILGCMVPRPSPCDSYGDMNRDGVVTNGDLTLIGNAISNPGSFDEDQLERADTNGSGSINVSDITHASVYVNCFSDTFSVCATRALFQKEITATMLPGDILEVSATISWVERGRDHEVKVISQLSDWR